MRFVGIDVGSQAHVVSVVDEEGRILVKPTTLTEDAAGYDRLFEILGQPLDILVAMEATGHYGRNLCLALDRRGFPVAVLNPLRIRRFAQEDLARAKTDFTDAVRIARFAAQKRPAATPLPSASNEELKELVRINDRLSQDFGDRVRQLHRLVHLCFPEFRRYVRSLDSYVATATLRQCPTAQDFVTTSPDQIARLGHSRRHVLGSNRAAQLIEAAKLSIARHDTPTHRAHVRYLCNDIDALRQRIRELQSEIDRRVRQHSVAQLLTTIVGIAPLTAARIIAAVDDPARFRNAAAFAAYVGAVPGTSKSGLWRPGQAPLCPLGNARLRSALWMPTIAAARLNPWLRACYQRAIDRGKPPKVALIAVMRKLLTAVYSVAKNKRPFVTRLPEPHRPVAPTTDESQT
jgi:transposase